MKDIIYKKKGVSVEMEKEFIKKIRKSVQLSKTILTIIRLIRRGRTSITPAELVTCFGKKFAPTKDYGRAYTILRNLEMEELLRKDEGAGVFRFVKNDGNFAAEVYEKDAKECLKNAGWDIEEPEL